MHRLLISTLLVLPLTGVAQVYRSTDPDGNVVFTDSPPAGGAEAERVDIGPTNTVAPPPSQPAPAPQPQADDPEAVSYSVSIVEPANETSFPMGPGNFAVSVKVKPALGETESLQLFLDDMPWGKSQRETSWALTNVFRGAHDLTVAIVDTKGESLVKSGPIRVFVHRPSINFRNRN